MSADLIISQSFMKEMNKGRHIEELTKQDFPRCPAKAYAIYVEGRNSPPTKAMVKGNYFETLVFGATEDGSKVRMKRKLNGEKTVEEKRVEIQAHRFQTTMAQERKMNFLRIRDHANIRIAENIIFRARMDMVTSFMDEDGVYYDEVIMDTKMTDSLDSTFGPFAWGNPANMDHTQATAYSWAFEKKYGHRVPFWYCVMDVSPNMKYKFIGGMISDMQRQEFVTDLRRTLAAISEYHKAKHWPKVPSSMNCKNCPVKNTCPSFAQGDYVERIFE